MSVVTGPPRRPGQEPTVVVPGVFDGVHRGHRHLIDAGRAVAEERGVIVTALTFDPHPMSVVRPDAAPCRLASLTQRVRLLQEAGADQVRVVTFDAALSQMSPQDFIDEYLVADLAAAAVVAGENFRFGHRAGGDLATLADAGLDVTGVPLMADGAAVWSSTRIRELITTGDVAAAGVGLARPHRVEGPVVHGDHRGRELGYPTANVAVAAGSCVPLAGVYAAWVVIDPYGEQARRVPAAVSVGANLTFGGTEPRVEAYVIEPGEWDLYDRMVAVDFIERIRGMVAFDSVADLLDAMSADVEAARRLLDSASAQPPEAAP